MYTRHSVVALIGASFHDSAWRQRLRRGCKSLALTMALASFAGAQSTAAENGCVTPHSESVRKLVSVVEYLQARHADANVAEKLVVKVMEDLAKESDPHARYYNVDAYRTLRLDLAGVAKNGETVSFHTLPGSRGYLRIHTFDERAPELLLKAIESMQAAAPNGLNGLVLDLRDNPGGLVRAAVAVAAVFLPADALVLSTNGAGLESKQEMRARPDDYLNDDQEDYLEQLPRGVKSIPLTVLVNRGSASASEILAGALQDHDRAKVIGTKTYGKGTVQTIIPLPDDTAIKFTTAYFHTPKGHRVDGQGVTPDMVILRAPKRELAQADGLSAPAGAVPVKVSGSCALNADGASATMSDLALLAGRDREDCQLQQAMLVLASSARTKH